MPYIMTPQRLSENIEMIDVHGWDFDHTTGVLIVRGKNTAIVETGHTRCGAQILAELKKRQIPSENIEYVCVTHRHGDHCGGATPLAEAFPKTIVAGHKYAIATLRDPERLNAGARQFFGKYAQDIRPLPSDAQVQELQDGDLLNLGSEVEIEAVGTPGHTSDHLAFYERKSRTLYTGDAAGLLGPQHHTVTPTSFPPSFKFDKYRASIEKLATFKPATLVFSHFGAVIAADIAKVFNRALESLDTWKDTVEEAWRQDASQKSVIAAIRTRFLNELEVFPPEARPTFIKVMALGLANSLLPKPD